VRGHRRPCLDCGRTIRGGKGSRCRDCARKAEATRQSRQPYRAAYDSPEYRSAREVRMRAAGGRCEWIRPDGSRCPDPAVETHHTIPLSTARSYDEAIALCVPELLRATCFIHNPRGDRVSVA
jgi:hypothetical protein